MNLLKNKEIKRMIIFCIIFIICFTILIAIITKKQLDTYKENVNTAIASIVGVIKTNYPDVDEEEIILILNDKSNENYGKEILEQYGISYNDYSVISLEEKSKNIIITNCVILVLVSVAFITIFICYLKYRQKEIDKLTQYIQKLANKEYSLDIEESAEGELSSLKNELYKITVMLKETADNSIASKEALSNSVSDISHQLKTPLTSILILLDNLSESENMDAETKRKFLDEISRQVKDMNFLIISLLQLSRLDAGVVEFTNEKINVNQMLGEIKNNLDIIAEIKNVDIKIDAENVYMRGDYNWNKEAIQNIVKNAVEHAKTQVIVNVDDNNVYTKIEIIDDGEGIDDNDVKHIFERFYKAKNASENSIGIGLALSKSIIEKQNRVYFSR